MRYGPSPGQNGATIQVAAESRIPSPAGTAVKEIPYDYVATFKLTGAPSHRLQDVINVSTEGVFVAVSIGYSFVPSATLLPTPQVERAGDGNITVDKRSIVGVTPLSILAGLPKAAFLQPEPPGPTLADQLAHSILRSTLVQLCPIEFRYSIVDSGTGRELQNQAIHNIAGLGSADGDRPFRPFAKPALFMPRSTIRIEVEEISSGPLFKDGTLFLVLHGYKRLGE